MTTPAGWYPDPSGKPMQRYFDGAQWTEHYAAATPVARPADAVIPPPSPPKPTSTAAKTFLIVGGIAAVAVLIALVVVGNNAKEKDDRLPSGRSSTAAGPTAGSDAGPTIVPAGSPARDGKFEFRILGLTSSRTVSDPTNNPYMTETAQGVFAVVTISVTNIGDQPQNYFGSNQKLIDTSGRQYEVSSAADMYVNSGVDVMGQINPGNSIQVKLPFDVPPDSRFTMLELHDSMFSGGVKMELLTN